MKRVAAGLFGLLLVGASCGKVASVQVEGCKADADCATTYLGEDCCPHCSVIVGTKSSIEGRESSCNGKPTSGRCPTVDCKQLIHTPACQGGRCVAVTKEWGK